MSIYFLTGASGAVGSAIVPDLLANPNTRLRLLLRADSEPHLAQRMEALFRFWKLAPDSPERLRIEAFRGDASKPEFGLPKATYAQLCADTQHIIHCAASVHMNKPLDEARTSALDSTQTILSFARALMKAGALQKVEFISTVGVGGKRPGILPETWIDEAREFHNTYEQSKAEAEDLVRAAIENEHLPVTVHRPSMVIGNSIDGHIIHFQIFYFICEFLSGRRTFGLYPDFGDTRLDVVPVDWVAKAIVAASTKPSTAGQIIHLCTGPNASPRLSELRALVRTEFRNHGLPTPLAIPLPRRVFGLLPRIVSPFIPQRRRKALMTLPIYLDYLSGSQGFARPKGNTWASDALTPSLPLPTIIRHYLETRYSSCGAPKHTAS
ncbi:MAG: SDR family oxidoreductase [Azoarcus sp.]|jgi:thioester reductase-like protein|nr:SDR family oxidoreductase [Azoarcus sp.]